MSDVWALLTAFTRNILWQQCITKMTYVESGIRAEKKKNTNHQAFCPEVWKWKLLHALGLSENSLSIRKWCRWKNDFSPNGTETHKKFYKALEEAKGISTTQGKEEGISDVVEIKVFLLSLRFLQGRPPLPSSCSWLLYFQEPRCSSKPCWRNKLAQATWAPKHPGAASPPAAHQHRERDATGW